MDDSAELQAQLPRVLHFTQQHVHSLNCSKSNSGARDQFRARRVDIRMLQRIGAL